MYFSWGSFFQPTVELVSSILYFEHFSTSTVSWILKLQHMCCIKEACLKDWTNSKYLAFNIYVEYLFFNIYVEHILWTTTFSIYWLGVTGIIYIYFDLVQTMILSKLTLFNVYAEFFFNFNICVVQCTKYTISSTMGRKMGLNHSVQCIN